MLNLVSCTANRSRDESSAIVKNDQHARQLYIAGNFYAAAKEYLALAEFDADHKVQYQLSAVNALINSRHLVLAKQVISSLQQQRLNNAQHILNNIYMAQILFAEGDADGAYVYLIANPENDIPSPVLAKFYETRAQILFTKDEYFAVAKNRARLNSYLDTAQEIDANYQKLWEALSNLSFEQISGYLKNNVGTLRSWLELAEISTNPIQNKDEFLELMATWQQRYPAHPASYKIVQTISDEFSALNQLPSQIALLLPFHTVYNEVSIAIREGFIAAWHQQRGDKPTIKIYPSNIENIVEVYQRAIDEGADFVVGPLQKTVISKLVEEVEPKTVPTLLLNQYKGERDVSQITSNSVSLPVFRQFYISPEEEARQVAERAWFDGHGRAIIIDGDDKIARRISAAFAEHWQELGGIILSNTSIESNIKDMRYPVQRILNIEYSAQRGKLLQDRLGMNLKTTLRGRDDVDFVFMAVAPVIGRRLVPELRHYQTKDIVFYSTSQIYTGELDSRLDSDLNHVIFNDMPWVVESEYKYSSLSRALERAHKSTYKNNRRLYAFGIDAYQIISKINYLMRKSTQHYQGTTGIIKFTPEGRVDKRLIWSRFINGKPELYNNIVDLN